MATGKNKHMADVFADAIAFEYSKPAPNQDKITNLANEGGRYLKKWKLGR